VAADTHEALRAVLDVPGNSKAFDPNTKLDESNTPDN